MDEQVAVRELTPVGMRRARDYLKSIRDNGWHQMPREILTGSDCAIGLEPKVYVADRSFMNRREVGRYLESQLESLGTSRIAGNTALWSWLGMFYLESMTKDNTRRQRDFAEIAYLIDPQTHDSRDRSHHRLMMAYDIWTRWGEDAWFLLDEAASSMGQFTLRVVQSPEIFRSRSIVPLALNLYVDRATGKLRPGSRGMNASTAPPGSLPRLIAVLNQLSMTYDVYGMTMEQLLPLLPQEFDSFHSHISPP